MGHLLSRVRKKTSVTDTLEQYEKEISSLEEYRRSTEQRQKRLVGSLLLYSVIVYIVLGTALYFYWFPSTVREQCLYAVPLLLFPFIVWLLKRLLQKYFKWKIEANSEQLTELLRKRRTILNDVKETETYKKAKEILEKFDPEYKLQEQKKKDAEAVLIRPKPLASSTVRRRSFPVQSNVPPRTIATSNVPPGMGAPPGFPQNGRPWLRPPPGPPVARPILPRERGVADRFVDYLIGDGPNNRYALICQKCLSHNGMALKEEFEYIAFRCCYCYYLNPPRKLRPQAPSLPSALSQPLPHPSQKSASEDESQKGELGMETSGEPEIETIIEESEQTEKEQEPTVEPEEETEEEISEVSETAQTIETTQELLEKEFEPETT